MTEQAPNVASPLCSTGGESASFEQEVAAGLPWWGAWVAIVLLAVSGTLLVRVITPEHVRGLFVPAVALLVCLLAAGFDAATARIPNSLNYTAILLGLGLNTAAGLADRLSGTNLVSWLGAAGAGSAFCGFALCAGIGIVCLTLAGMGGGDVKLLVAVGALLGFAQSSRVLLLALLVAVPYALVNLLIAGRLNGVLRAAAAQLLQLAYMRRIEPVAPPSRTSIPLAVPVLVALVLNRVLPPAWLAHWIG